MEAQEQQAAAPDPDEGACGMKRRESGLWLIPAVMLWVGSWLFNLAASGDLAWLLTPRVH